MFQFKVIPLFLELPSFPQAQHSGADTVSIKDSQTNTFLKGLTGSPVWTSGKKTGYSWENGYSWVWGDGSKISFTNWLKGEPNNYNKALNGEDAIEFNVQYKKGFWNDRHRSYKICTICQYHVGTDYGTKCMPGYPCDNGPTKSKNVR